MAHNTGRVALARSLASDVAAAPGVPVAQQSVTRAPVPPNGNSGLPPALSTVAPGCSVVAWSHLHQSLPMLALTPYAIVNCSSGTPFVVEDGLVYLIYHNLECLSTQN